MEAELHLTILLESPPAGVDFGLQQGKGNDYQTIQKQRSKGGDLRFECVVTAKDNRDDGLPNFLGPLTQGPPTNRFIYIDIGKLAGQNNAVWERRIKVPLAGITWKMIEQVVTDAKLTLEARLPGTAKDGGPSCATLRPIGGWKLSQRAG
jgi:hypothetical protein